jgi:hypothetical protein
LAAETNVCRDTGDRKAGKAVQNMSRGYGKVVVGEPVEEESSPFLAYASPVGGVGGGSNSVGVVATAVPRGPPPPRHPPPHRHPPLHHPPPPPPPLHRYNQFGTFQNGGVPVTIAYQDEPGEECARLGCCFSWLPPIGFLTCIVHADAPPHSRREQWARASCFTATLVTIALVVYIVYFRNSDTGSKVPLQP